MELSSYQVTGGAWSQNWGNTHCLFVTYPSGGSSKKIFGGPDPSSFGRQQRLSEITIEPIKNLGTWARFGGLCPPGRNLEPPLTYPLFVFHPGFFFPHEDKPLLFSDTSTSKRLWQHI